MTKRERELAKVLPVVAEQANARLVDIRKTNGGHVRRRFDRGTPSDRVRTIKNDAAQARRLLRRMTA